MKKNNRLLTGLKHLGRKIRQNIQTIGDAFVVLIIVLTVVGIFKFITVEYDSKSETIKETAPLEKTHETNEEPEPEYVPSGPGSTEKNLVKSKKMNVFLLIYTTSLVVILSLAGLLLLM